MSQEVVYEKAKQGPAITITLDLLKVDASHATVPTAEFTWDFIDRLRASLLPLPPEPR